MIIASIYVTGGAILVGVPVALFTSVFMARYCPQKIYRPLKSGIELMAGVPSIVYGFFGLVLMVPLIRSTFGGTGTSWLAASLLLGIMILPTIIGVLQRSAIRAVFRRVIMKVLWHLVLRRKEVSSVAMLPAAKVRYSGRCCAGNRSCYRRDNGGDHGSRKPGKNARQ